jgi:phosphate transport system substrate-binding protein
LKREWASRPIHLYGRNAGSDAYGHFRARVLSSGAFKATIEERPGSSSVVQAVSADPSGIGYATLVSGASGVRILPVADERGASREATEANVRDGIYPLRRGLVLYIRRPPGRALPLALREFVRFATSREGQELARKAGLVPLSEAMAAAERAKVE